MNLITDWTDEANCIGKNDLFITTAFSASEQVKSPDDIRAIAEAKHLCITCPVRQKCLDTAMLQEKYLGAAERHGIRGGLTAKQRIFAAIKEESRCASCHTNPLPPWDRVYLIRTICRSCQTRMQSDPALKYQLKLSPV